MSLARRMKDVQDAPEHGDEPAPQPCRYCGDSTPYKVLAHYGARCTRCYIAYCQTLPPRPDRMTGGKE